MRKVVITFGLISGAISSLMMSVTLPFLDRIGFERAEVLGYTTIVLSFLMVFFGVRSYRDNVAGGSLTFGRGFLVGMLITLISCACYVLTWEIIYYNFLPGFVDQYSAYTIDQLRASGAGPEAIQTQIQEMEKFKELYKNPFINAAITFIEPFPIGLGVTLITAATLRRKPAVQPAEARAGI